MMTIQPEDMPCYLCGLTFDSMGYTCRHCEFSFCVEHHLPESHNCIALNHEQLLDETDSENGQPWFKDEYRLSNVGAESEAGEKEFEQQQTKPKQQADKRQKLKEVAKQVEEKRSPDYEPTPDVAVDGSVVEPDSQTSSDTVEGVGDTSARNSNILLFLVGLVVIFGILIAVYVV